MGGFPLFALSVGDIGWIQEGYRTTEGVVKGVSKNDAVELGSLLAYETKVTCSSH